MSFRRAPLCGLDRGASFVISRLNWRYFCTLIAVIQPGTLDSYCMGCCHFRLWATEAHHHSTWPSIFSSLLAYHLFLVPPHANPTRCQLEQPSCLWQFQFESVRSCNFSSQDTICGGTEGSRVLAISKTTKNFLTFGLFLLLFGW